MAKLRRVTQEQAARWLLPRAKGAHKGDAGRVYLIAGSKGMAGAAVLSSLGAVRSGAGLVRIGIVASQQPVIARRAPLEVTSDALPEDRSGRLGGAAVREIRAALKKFSPDVIAVGPGLGRSPGASAAIRFLLFAQRTPVVIDADGLNALADLGGKSRVAAPVIMTPHPGEMGRLLGTNAGAVSRDRPAAVVSAARRFGAVALLKGSGTLVSDGKEIWMNTTGNPAMATGGMGDILTGIVAATWSQMPEQTRTTGVRAAALAAFIHGLAADLAVKRFPERTLVASDLAETLPPAFQTLWRRKSRGG